MDNPNLKYIYGNKAQHYSKAKVKNVKIHTVSITDNAYIIAPSCFREIRFYNYLFLPSFAFSICGNLFEASHVTHSIFCTRYHSRKRPQHIREENVCDESSG